MEDLTNLSENEIKARIATLRERESAHYKERTALELEVRRRASAATRHDFAHEWGHGVEALQARPATPNHQCV